MSYREFCLWTAYRLKYGPLNPIRMYDQMGAIVAMVINNAHGGKKTVTDFLPYHKEEEEIVDEDGFIAALGNTRVKVAR